MKDKEPGQVPVSRIFHERLCYYNSLDKLGFKEWIFHPAMLFGSRYKWWGSQERRERMHEGLDLCLYRTEEGNIHYGEENTKIPVLFNGHVVKINDDFLGESVFISHGIYDLNGSQLYTIYGHVKHGDHIHPGEKLNEGDSIGVIADKIKSGGVIPQHLHISVAWITNTVHPQELGWQMMDDPTMVTLIDPLYVIECPYSIVPYI